MPDENKWNVVKFVQGLLVDESDKSATAISDKINLVLAMKPAWGVGLDRTAVTKELIERFSEWAGEDSTLINEEGHVEWFTAEHKRDWRYWQRYREFQESKLSWAAIESVDKTTDKIISMLEDPKRVGSWDRRGMVVGHVQSGKTGNYTGLVCKAADAGYKIIIVLAGLHNNLRSQTQLRLDEGFLGFETTPDTGEKLKRIGVGLINKSPDLVPQFGTNRTEKGDFIAKFAKNFGVLPEERPWLFVVKKNKTVLTRLLKWIQKHVAHSADPVTQRPLVTHLPLLVIDDEADHASVDTGEKIVDEHGVANAEHEPKTINSLIRQILHSFSRSAYVGYTATPFANIYIHKNGETDKEGPDLFPSSFIMNLSAPSSYVGPAKVFGVASETGRAGALCLIRDVSDQCSEDKKTGWMPVGHKAAHIPLSDGQDCMPTSLVEAIHAFILASAARNCRGQAAQHSSMLIHVTRFNRVQEHVHRQVEEYILQIKRRIQRKIDHVSLLAELKALWGKDFCSTSTTLNETLSDTIFDSDLPWHKIELELPGLLDEIDVRMINGYAKEALDYADSKSALKLIAIGGDKLARGLTLEGLCVSYFLRASKMYDTLMQMGRWFGYRPGYLDLCRLYTTADLVKWFEHIADASEELRAEFEFMIASGMTPEQYGLKVKSHPVLMVTSPLKMKAGKKLHLSFSGDIVETVSFYVDATLDKNLKAFDKLVAELGSPKSMPIRSRGGKTDNWNGAYWDSARASYVSDFLRAYLTHPDSRKVRSDLLADFVEKLNGSNELTQWTVAVFSGSSSRTYTVGGKEVKLTVRKEDADGLDKYSIGRLVSPRDEAIDLDESAWLAALKLTVVEADRKKVPKVPIVPSGVAIRHVRGFGAIGDGVLPAPERGVLLVYLIEPKEQTGWSASPVVAFAISFPGSSTFQTVPYIVNSVYMDEIYASAE